MPRLRGGWQPDGSYRLDDSELELAPVSPVCTFCAHWKRNATSGRYCAAFPRDAEREDGIPADIWNGRHTHRTPWPGDRGVRFTLAPDVAAPALVLEDLDALDREAAARRRA